MKWRQNIRRANWNNGLLVVFIALMVLIIFPYDRFIGDIVRCNLNPNRLLLRSDFDYRMLMKMRYTFRGTATISRPAKDTFVIVFTSKMANSAHLLRTLYHRLFEVQCWDPPSASVTAVNVFLRKLNSTHTGEIYGRRQNFGMERKKYNFYLTVAISLPSFVRVLGKI